MDDDLNEIQERIADDMAEATMMGDDFALSKIVTFAQASDECNELAQEGRFVEAIEKADFGIGRLEQYIASNPSTKTVLGFTLSQLYMVKVICYTQLGQTDVNLKKQALQNLETCFRVTNLPPQLKSSLLQLKQGLEKEIATELSKKNDSCAPKAAAMLIILFTMVGLVVSWLF